MRLYALIAGLALATACSGTQEPAGPPFHAFVLDQTSVDPESGRGEFAVVRRDLTRITRLSLLEGPDYRVVRGGVLNVRAIGGSVVVDGAFTGGDAAEPRYRIEDDTIIARDYTSLALLSAARQFERVFDVFDSYGPYPAQALFAEGGRPTIYFEPAIEVSGSTSATAILKFNAFFAPRSHAFGLARRSSSEDVPLAGDVKVIAHELGHAVFYKAFDAATDEPCQPAGDQRSQHWFPGRLDYEYAMHGLNEGFADWHAFSVTGSVNPVANQSAVLAPRNIRYTDFDFDALARAGKIRDTPDPYWQLACTGGFYCLGTLFAHALYAAYVASGHDPEDARARADFTGALVRALEQTKAAMQDGGLLPPALDDVAACRLREDFNAEYDGAVLSAFFGALLGRLTSELRPPLCDALIEAFGALGFSPAARAECSP